MDVLEIFVKSAEAKCMTKQCLSWKPVTCKNVRGLDFPSSLPELVSLRYRGSLLNEILNMPRKNAISFEEAIQMVSEKRVEAAKACDGLKRNWYYQNFINYISESGFHIELSGDEFVFHLSTTEA